MGTVMDDQDVPVNEALVHLNEAGIKIHTFTDTNGVFRVKWNGQFPAFVSISHPGFEEYKLELTSKMWRDGHHQEIALEFQLKTQTLRTAVVSALNIPDTVFGSKQLSVADYAFLDDKLVLLSYNQSLKKGAQVLLANRQGSVLQSFRMEKEAQSLFTDYRGRVFALCGNKVYHIKQEDKEYKLQEVDGAAFANRILPVLDTIGEHLYFSNYSSNYPAFSYYMMHRNDTLPQPFCRIEDADMMELYRAEYKYVPNREKLWAWRQELKTGVDREIWIGAKYFTSSIYYEPLYAPLFTTYDTLVVFDNYTNYLKRFSCSGTFLDSLPIDYHQAVRPAKWLQKLVKDEVTQQVYSLLLEGTHIVLCHIDPSSGRITGRHKVYFKYGEQVRVRDGKVFYIYRPFESSQKKYLYAERIRLK